MELTGQQLLCRHQIADTQVVLGYLSFFKQGIILLDQLLSEGDTSCLATITPGIDKEEGVSGGCIPDHPPFVPGKLFPGTGAYTITAFGSFGAPR